MHARSTEFWCKTTLSSSVEHHLGTTGELCQWCLRVRNCRVLHERALSYSTCTGSNSLLQYDAQHKQHICSFQLSSAAYSSAVYIQTELRFHVHRFTLPQLNRTMTHSLTYLTRTTVAHNGNFTHFHLDVGVFPHCFDSAYLVTESASGRLAGWGLTAILAQIGHIVP